MTNFGIKTRFRICELFGIPLYLDFSFGFLLVYICLSVGSVDYGIAVALTLAVSITLHELGHSLTARAFGYSTRDITLSLLGGCASLTALPRKAWQEFLTAIAGPAVSFVLGTLAYILLFGTSIESEWLCSILFTVYVMNFMLGLFNLLPALPMDGGRMFRSALSVFLGRLRATEIAMYVGRAVAVALVLLPVFGIQHIWIFPIGGNFFLRLMIAWMVWQEGYREYQMAKVESSWRRWSQDDFRARVSPPPYDD